MEELEDIVRIYAKEGYSQGTGKQRANTFIKTPTYLKLCDLGFYKNTEKRSNVFARSLQI
jgi:hypothetical protein